MQLLQSLGRSRDKGRENGILDPYLLTATEPEPLPRPRIRLDGTSLRNQLSRFQCPAAGCDGPAINWLAFMESVSRQIQEKEAAQHAEQQRTLQATHSVRAPRGSMLLLGSKRFNSVRTRFVTSPASSRDSSPDHPHPSYLRTTEQDEEDHGKQGAAEPPSSGEIAREAAAVFRGVRGGRTRRRSRLAFPAASSHDDLSQLAAAGTQQGQVQGEHPVHPFAAALVHSVAAIGGAQNAECNKQLTGPHSWAPAAQAAAGPLQSARSSAPMLCIAPDVHTADRKQLQSELHQLFHTSSQQHAMSPPSSTESHRVTRVVGAALRGVARLLQHHEPTGTAGQGHSPDQESGMQACHRRAPNAASSPVFDGAAAAKPAVSWLPPARSPPRSPGAAHTAAPTPIPACDDDCSASHKQNIAGQHRDSSLPRGMKPFRPAPGMPAGEQPRLNQAPRPSPLGMALAPEAAAVVPPTPFIFAHAARLEIPSTEEEGALTVGAHSLDDLNSVSSAAPSIRSQTVTVPPTPTSPGPPTMAAWHEIPQQLAVSTPTAAAATTAATASVEHDDVMAVAVASLPYASSIHLHAEDVTTHPATPSALPAAMPLLPPAAPAPTSTPCPVQNEQQAGAAMAKAVEPAEGVQEPSTIVDQGHQALSEAAEVADQLPGLAGTGRRRLLEMPPHVPVSQSPSAAANAISSTLDRPKHVATSLPLAALPIAPPPVVISPQPTVGWLPKTNTAFLNAAASIAPSVNSSASPFQLLDQDFFRILSDAVPVPGTSTSTSQPCTAAQLSASTGGPTQGSGLQIGTHAHAGAVHHTSLLQLAQQILLVSEPATASTKAFTSAEPGADALASPATQADKNDAGSMSAACTPRDVTVGNLPTVFSITDSGDAVEVPHPQSDRYSHLQAAAAAATIADGGDDVRTAPSVFTPVTPEGSVEGQPLQASRGQSLSSKQQQQLRKQTDSGCQFNSMQLQVLPRGAAAARTISDGLWQPAGSVKGISWHTRHGSGPQQADSQLGSGAVHNQLSATTEAYEDQEQSYWSVAHSDITLIRRLGSGSYGEVWLAQYHFVDVAVKLIPWTWSSALHAASGADSSASQQKEEAETATERDLCVAELARFRQEVDFQRRLSLHPNIVPFIGACEPCMPHESSPTQQLPGAGHAGRISANVGDAPSSDQLAIVMGYCKLGDLYNMIRKARMVSSLLSKNRKAEAAAPSLAHAMLFYQSWERRLDVAAGAAAGLYHMHSKGVIHRDLTSYNILLDAGFSAKVSDFNLSRVVPRGTSILLANSGSLNSPLWQGPEMLRGDVMYDGKLLDVFSFGIILSEIITLWVPYTQGSEEEATALMSDMRFIWPLIGKIAAGVRPYLPVTRSELQPPLPSRLSAEQADEVFSRLVELTQSCWSQTPSNRPSMQHVAGELRALVGILRGARQLLASCSGGRQSRAQQREG